MSKKKKKYAPWIEENLAADNFVKHFRSEAKLWSVFFMVVFTSVEH
jgi:hypothetical protein